MKKSIAKSISSPIVLTNLLSDSFSRFRFTIEVRILLTMCNDLFNGLSYGLLFRAKSILCMTVIVSLISDRMALSLGNLQSTIVDDIVSTDFEVFVHSHSEIQELKDAIAALPNVYGLRTD